MKKQRLSDRNYTRAISGTKKSLDLTYTEIASWMGITPSNLRSMISQELNPTEEEWINFKKGLAYYQADKKALVKKLMNVENILNSIQKQLK